MSKLTFIPESMLPQGSDIWKKRRSVVGTATQAACVAGEPNSYANSPKTWMDLRTERMFGSTFTGNADTQRGQRLEPIARALFNEIYKGKVEPMEPIWCERSLANGPGDRAGVEIWSEPDLPVVENATIASSFDGYSRNGDYHAWLEIKCPRGMNSKTWKAVDAGRIPDDYYWQVVHQRATFGDQIAFGYFMVYLEDGDHLIMAVEDDARVQSGQFGKDVKYICDQWGQFLEGAAQAGDMAQSSGWLSAAKEMVDAREKRLEMEAEIKPYTTAENTAKEHLRDMIVHEYGQDSGLRRAFGGRVAFVNHPKTEFNLTAFRTIFPDYDLNDYVADVDYRRLCDDFPEAKEFIHTEDSWRVSVRKD